MNLGPQFALPGMENMRQAEPHEQTERQFHNRPDVFFHGRMAWPEVSHSEPPSGRGSWEFHAGTSASAVERMDDFGVPRSGKEPRFYAGRVDPRQMENKPPAEGPHHHPDQVVRFKGNPDNRYMTHVAQPASNEWRIKDPGEDWDPEDVNHYYRNDHEDVGSTSVLLGTYGVEKQQNFVPWRSSVQDALESGKRVPHHVKSIYEASGGAEGRITHMESDYQRPRSGPPTRGHPSFDVSSAIGQPDRFVGLSEPESRAIREARQEGNGSFEARKSVLKGTLGR